MFWPRGAGCECSMRSLLHSGARGCHPIPARENGIEYLSFRENRGRTETTIHYRKLDLFRASSRGNQKILRIFATVRGGGQLDDILEGRDPWRHRYRLSPV